MRAFSGVSEAIFVLFVILISPSSTSPHFHNIINNRPIALLLPNGKIVRSQNCPEYDPQNQNPALPGQKPSKGSICSLLTANFSNQRRKGFAEVQSRVHEINRGMPFRPSRHIQPVSVFTSSPTNLQKYQYQPIYHQNSHRCFSHSQPQFHSPGTQISCILNQPSSFPAKTNGKKIDFKDFNGLLNSEAPKSRKTVEYTIENNAGYENVISRERELESVQATSKGPRNVDISASDSPTRGLQYEKSSPCSDRDCGSMLEFPDEIRTPQVVTSIPTKCPGVNKEPGNPIPREAGSIQFFLVGNKAMLSTPERIGQRADSLPSVLGQCLPALQMSPDLPPHAPICVACSNCLPIMPWVPRSPTAPSIVPWCPRMVPPPWTPEASCFPRTPCQPWSPETPIILEPFNVVFANRCSPPGPFVHLVTVTAATDTALVYLVDLPNILSPTSALNFFPPGNLNTMEPQEFTDLLHLLIIYH